MPDVDLPLPFEAYVGPQPFVFVSYAHKDGRSVFPELALLHSAGYRIWYDEGIDPGNEWPDEIAKALGRSAFFLVFISKGAIESQNVRNEINYALNKKKPFLAVYIEDVTLPPGLELRMGDIQAIMKWRMTDEHYARKIEKTLPSSLMEKKTETMSYAEGSMHGWWKVVTSPGGGEDVEVECTHCELRRSYDPLFGERPPEKCPACGFDGVKAPGGPWYITKSAGAGDRDYICMKCKHSIFVTHFESDPQIPDQCPECGFSR